MRVLSLFLLIGIFAVPQISEAQFRDTDYEPTDYSGVVSTDNSGTHDLGWFDFRMDHSYEMTVGSFGGNTYNQNFYTNTMHFLFNENLTGRVDLSVAHSPFGNSLFGEDQGPQFFIRNAELNYNITDNTQLRFQFRQIPGGMYNPYGYGHGYYNPYRSRFSGHQGGFNDW